MSSFSTLYDIKPIVNLAYEYAENWYFEAPYSIPGADLSLVKVLAGIIQDICPDKSINICHSFASTMVKTSGVTPMHTDTLYAIELDGVWFHRGQWLDQKEFEKHVVAERKGGLASDFACKHRFVEWSAEGELELDAELYDLIKEEIQKDGACQAILEKLQLSQSTPDSQRVGYKPRL
jgi:Zn-finger nucleic acid-binding protein